MEYSFYNPPGGQGGFFWADPYFKGKGSKGTKIVDIICSIKNIFLVVECKPKFSLKDKTKLEELFLSSERIQYFKEKLLRHCTMLDLAIDTDNILIYKALGFSGRIIEVPIDFVLFQVSESDTFVISGSEIPASIVSICDRSEYPELKTKEIFATPYSILKTDWTVNANRR